MNDIEKFFSSRSALSGSYPLLVLTPLILVFKVGSLSLLFTDECTTQNNGN